MPRRFQRTEALVPDPGRCYHAGLTVPNFDHVPIAIGSKAVQDAHHMSNRQFPVSLGFATYPFCVTLACDLKEPPYSWTRLLREVLA